jgi:putative transposase
VTLISSRLIERHGRPEEQTVDKGTEFTSSHFDAWSRDHKLQLGFIRPGRPVDDAFIESLNGWLWDECLNANWFLHLAEAQATLDAWRRDYNRKLPTLRWADSRPLSTLRSSWWRGKI